jgi:rubrerythrin
MTARRAFTGTDLTCPACNYKWHYKGKLAKATCPSCSRTIKVPVETKGRAPA